MNILPRPENILIKIGDKDICYLCETEVIATKDNYFESYCDSGSLCEKCLKTSFKIRNLGGSVFSHTGETINYGMNLKDYFAGQVLMGSMACKMGFKDDHNNMSCDMTAKMCYEFADAMLKERLK